MASELSQSKKAIQKVVFKIFERWNNKEDRLSLLLSLIENPSLSSREEKQLIQILVPIKHNSEDFDANLKDACNIFDEYQSQKKEMLSLLNQGSLNRASQIKDNLIGQYAPMQDEINASYEEVLVTKTVHAKKKIDKLIFSKDFKLAKEFLDSSEFLLKDYEAIKAKIAYLSLNYQKQQEFLDHIKNNLFEEIATEEMSTLWLKLVISISNKEMQELLDAISKRVTELLDNKLLFKAEILIKHITNLRSFPEALSVSLMARREKAYDQMIYNIQKLIDTKKFEAASEFLVEFELAGFQSKDLANKIFQSSRAEEIKVEIFKKIEENNFFEIYPLLTNTMFSSEDSKLIYKELAGSLKTRLDVNEIDFDQATALICDHQFQLLSARAGSGKTTTLINKVKLLKSLNRINLSEYLFLAFNSKVREEISQEIAMTFGINADEVKSSNVHTFHSFAGRVSSNSLPGHSLIQGEEQANLYRQCFQESLKDNIFNSLYKKYLSTIVHPNEDDLDKFDRSNFDSDEDYFAARNSARLLTLNNVHVKSLGEKLIGDFFFEHEIAFTYEPTRITEDNKIYRPDFYINYLTNKEDKKIYIELWGIYKNGSSDSQSAPFDISKYKEERLKKLDYWEENSWNTSLLELFMDDIYGNNLNPNKDFASFKENFYKVLQIKLEKITDHKFNRLSEEQVMQKVSKIFESRILGSLSTYIQNVKNNQITQEQLNLKINKFENILTRRAKAFLDLGHEFRRAIHKQKGHAKVIEYADSIELAGNAIEAGINLELVKDKKYLFVDEFQDTNFGFMRIIKAIVNVNPEINVVCVGDDWQSINSFMGARTTIYHSLDQYLPGLERNKILTNYRSGRSIVDYGNNVMRGLGDPCKSFLSQGSVHYLDIFSTKNSKDFNLYIDSDKNKYDDGFKLQHYHKILFDLIKFEINSYTLEHSNKSIYDIPKDAKLLILSRNKKINSESVEFTLLPIVINSLTKYFLSIGYKEGRQEIITRLNQLVSYSSIHAIKGGEADAVFLLEANANNMPMRHPDRELSAVFYDDPRTADTEADAEERRLYYVAVTRAKESLYVVTSASEKSIFMSNKAFVPLEKFSVDYAVI